MNGLIRQLGSLAKNLRRSKAQSAAEALQAEIGDIARDMKVSFEFFPAKTPEAEKNLFAAADKLASLRPSFMTVTYGAGGSTRDKTHATAREIARNTGLPVAAHLTCVAASRDEIHAIADAFWQDGIRHIVALRGDMPGGGAYVPHPDGYPYTSFLVSGLKKRHDFEISVAAYPEKHPDAPSLDADLDALKRKLDAGADRAITQFFFDPATYLRFIEKARAKNIHQPIVPGILPIGNFAQVVKFARQCGAEIPADIHETFRGIDEDPETRKLAAAIVAVEQCRALYKEGVRHFHFYTLNKADLVFAVCHMLGLRPAEIAKPPALQASIR